MLRFTLKQMAVFDAVARLGSVSKAAEEIALSQSAASMALKELEDNLGTQLFHRHGRRLTLNENGKRLRPQAHSLLLMAEEIAQPRKTELEGMLRVGASTTVGTYFLPDCVTDFLRRYPKVQIQLVVAGIVETTDRVEAMSVHLGLIDSMCNRNTIQTEPVGIDRAVIFAASDHPLARRQAVSIEDLRAAKWCLRESPSMTRTHLSEALDIGGLRNVRFEATGFEAVKTAIKAGLGLGFGSYHSIAEEVACGELSVIEADFVTFERRFTMLTPKQVYQSALPMAFAQHLRDWFASECAPAPRSAELVA